ncbi:MAG: hypothetical protein M3169_00335 [Candidatus Eremiobacteraeota bacterium]|nr:hypothetical protein [Candidatus Eremiobacteraeota bacterium]
MKHRRLAACGISLIAALTLFATVPAGAEGRRACSLVPAAKVRSILGAVQIVDGGVGERGGVAGSSCQFLGANNGVILIRTYSNAASAESDLARARARLGGEGSAMGSKGNTVLMVRVATKMAATGHHRSVSDPALSKQLFDAAMGGL